MAHDNDVDAFMADFFNSDEETSDFEGFSASDLESDEEVDLDLNQEPPEVARNDGWTDRFSNLMFDEFRERTGPNLPDDFDRDTARPLDYFLLLFPMTLVEDIVQHTNSYARWKMDQEEKEDDKWVDTDLQEMRAFLGINITMGVQQMPDLDSYWSTNPFVGNPGIQSTMTCNRFQKLTQYFHVSDRASEPRNGADNYDKLYKVRDVINTVSETFRQYYTLSREVSVDEAMVRYTGRLSFRQYMPAKPIKRGVKIWMLCDAHTAYLAKFDVYLGRQPTLPEHGLGHSVVTNLTEHLQNTNRHVYFDNFFTSIPLMKSLKDNGLYACGTVRTNRKDFPQELKKPRDVQIRGEFKALQYGDSNLTATVWKDKRLVHHLSTNSDPTVVAQTQRRVGRDVYQVPQPECVHKYNQFMGGVDLHDQFRMKYDVGRNSKKWWRYLFWFVLNCAVVNAFIMYRIASRRQTKKKRYSHKDFRIELFMDLIGGFSKRKRSGVQRECLGVVPVENIEGHTNAKLPGPRRRCRHHLAMGKRKETCYGCTVCNVHLCRDGCHHLYHNQ